MARDLGVIFDMDGVLIDSTEAHYEAWRRTGVWLGVPYPRPLFDRTFGMHNRQSIALWLGKQVDEAERQRIADYKESMYREAAKKSLRPIPGVLPLLHALAAEGFHLAVGSSGPSQNVQLALEVIGAATVKAISIAKRDKSVNMNTLLARAGIKKPRSTIRPRQRCKRAPLWAPSTE
jgi:beta-phosphoglucomutase